MKKESEVILNYRTAAPQLAECANKGHLSMADTCKYRDMDRHLNQWITLLPSYVALQCLKCKNL